MLAFCSPVPVAVVVVGGGAAAVAVATVPVVPLEGALALAAAECGVLWVLPQKKQM